MEAAEKKENYSTERRRSRRGTRGRGKHEKDRRDQGGVPEDGGDDRRGGTLRTKQWGNCNKSVNYLGILLALYFSKVQKWQQSGGMESRE